MKLYDGKFPDYIYEQVFAAIMATVGRLREYSGGIAQIDDEI